MTPLPCPSSHRPARRTPAASADDAASERLAACLARVALGDGQAFRDLHDLTRDRLLAIASEIARQRERAEDILQDAYLTVWHLAARYDPTVARPMTWLISIVRHRAIDALRAHRSRQHLNLPLDDGASETVPDLAPRPEQAWQRARRHVGLSGALERLGGCERQALALVLYRGMSHADIAAQCHVPVVTAKNWVRRGLARVRKDLEAAGPRARPVRRAGSAS